MANALAASASPYLRQHAGNPVDWRPWGDDAFAEARRRDVPVLVSIGYSTCHWCHVMAHECFEDAATAALMNRELVCIKVDREEHPEVDAIYMDAVQGLTGHGGWPLNAFTDHQGRPFHACTYLPRPRWGQLVEHLGGLWRSDRARLDQAAGEITAWLRRQDAANPAALPDDILDRLDAQVAQAFDEQDPGLAWSPERAPKFPPSALLGLLVDLGGERLARAEAILAAMQDGGLHDRVGGGFHRYSVDAAWRLPHFEKMLYDNAQLMGVYARAGARLGRGDFLATAINAADYVLRDLRVEPADAGVFAGYAAAEDADDAGGEGSFYAWSPAQLAAVLGDQTGAVLAREWDLRLGQAEIGPGGHAEPVISHIPHPRAAGIPAGEAGQHRRAAWEAHLPVLRAARAARPRPGRDDKVLTDQNGLLLAGLAWVARLGGQERHRQAVAELAAALRRRQGPDGLLRLPGRPAYITDYGALASGLLAAFDLLGDAALVDAAMAVVDEAAARLGDGAGGFHTTPAGRTDLVRRGREPLDNAWPAGQSQLAWAAARLAHVDGAPRWGDLVDGVLASAGAVAVQAPVSSATLLAAWQARRTGGVLVVAGGGAPAAALLAAARALPIADAIVPAGIARPWACLEGRRDEVSAAAHRCRQGACALSVRDAAGLAALV